MSDKTQKPYSRIVVFGDSLSDTGTLRSRTFGFLLSEKYFWRGRFSNGPVWIDYVKGSLNSKVSNYAVGGAVTYDTSGFTSFFVDSLTVQMESYLEDFREDDRKRHLAVLWIGPNNYFIKPSFKVERTIGKIEEAVRRLFQAGLQQIVIGTMPQLSLLPMNSKPGRGHIDRALEKATLQHNRLMIKTVKKLRAEFRGRQILLWRSDRIYQRTIDQPEKFGFMNWQSPCFSGEVRRSFWEKESVCSQPLRWKFWDELHPNTLMHCYYGSQFLWDVFRTHYKAYSLNKGIRKCRTLITDPK